MRDLTGCDQTPNCLARVTEFKNTIQLIQLPLPIKKYLKGNQTPLGKAIIRELS